MPGAAGALPADKMKKLKHIRILISLLMLGECLMLALLGAAAPLHARLAGATQLGGGVIVTSVAATMGAWVLWLIVTLLLGRVYCGAFCPAGALQDIFSVCGRFAPAAGRITAKIGATAAVVGAGRLHLRHNSGRRGGAACGGTLAGPGKCG